MRVVYVEPNKAPYVAEVAHTLEAEQKAVGGYIEVVYPDDNETCIICNEEGKLIGMEGNRRIGDGSSIKILCDSRKPAYAQGIFGHRKCTCRSRCTNGVTS